MKGLTIIETEAIDGLMDRISKIEELFLSVAQKLEDSTNQWMSFQETCEYIKKSTTWLYANKGEIGFSKVGAQIIFNRADVDIYLKSRYFKTR